MGRLPMLSQKHSAFPVHALQDPNHVVNPCYGSVDGNQNSS